LAVLDWLMPGLDGVQLCYELRRRGDEAYVYIVLLTAKHTKRDVIEGLEAGADDYITKPFEPQELRVRLRNGKRILCLMDQLILAREALREQAARDPLTGLWNHNAVLELLSKEIDRAHRQSTCVGVVLLDLDHFKRINDTYGHLMGDHVLRKTAAALQGSIRPYDAAGRFGGEEFLLVLPGCDRMNAISHAERLRMVLNRLIVEAPAGRAHVTASFGVTVVDSAMLIDADGAVHVADSALYAAKAAGRDRVEFVESGGISADPALRAYSVV
jgi:diguanylate cyclase (GGDEF)-like protein